MRDSVINDSLVIIAIYNIIIYLFYFILVIYDDNCSSTFLLNALFTKKEGRKEMFYLTMHSTHFLLYGYMASDIYV